MSELTIDVTHIIKKRKSIGKEQDRAYRDLLEAVEPLFFDHLLAFTNGNISEAARVSGLDRSTIYRRLKQYDIHPTHCKQCKHPRLGANQECGGLACPYRANGGEV